MFLRSRWLELTYDHKKKGIMSCYKAMQTDLMLYNTLTEKVKILREKSCKGNCFEYPFKFGSSKHKDVVKKKNQDKSLLVWETERIRPRETAAYVVKTVNLGDTHLVCTLPLFFIEQKMTCIVTVRQGILCHPLGWVVSSLCHYPDSFNTLLNQIDL